MEVAKARLGFAEGWFVLLQRGWDVNLFYWPHHSIKPSQSRPAPSPARLIQSNLSELELIWS